MSHPTLICPAPLLPSLLTRRTAKPKEFMRFNDAQLIIMITIIMIVAISRALYEKYYAKCFKTLPYLIFSTITEV